MNVWALRQKRSMQFYTSYTKLLTYQIIWTPSTATEANKRKSLSCPPQFTDTCQLSLEIADCSVRHLFSTAYYDFHGENAGTTHTTASRRKLVCGLLSRWRKFDAKFPWTCYYSDADATRWRDVPVMETWRVIPYYY